MKRRIFVSRALGIMGLALGGQAFYNCSGSDDGLLAPVSGGSGAERDCLANGTRVTIEGNHGHTLTVSPEDVKAGREKTYSIQGSSGHIHQLTITAEDFKTLQDTSIVELTSNSVNGHSHSVLISCA